MLLPLSARLMTAILLMSLGLMSCGNSSAQTHQQIITPSSTQTAASVSNSMLAATSTSDTKILQESWQAYQQRFIQADGRVIDREADDRSTSEGQAYAMLRAVLIDDQKTFARTLNWAENNLQRQDESGKRIDQLWAWKWGRGPKGNWQILDANFASDADIDAITALILASRRWKRSEYLTLARTKLQDLWRVSTVQVGKQRHLLPGPAEAFQTSDTVTLNPSYLAPYAFRLFAQVDSKHNWMSLVDSSYQVLQDSAAVSKVKLPSDWIALNTRTGQFQPAPASTALVSRYGFDAYRVWWRISLDAAWFQAPEAKRYLQQHTKHLQQLWRSQQKLPAQIDLQGKAEVGYEATSQYGALYAAFRLIDPKAAEQIRQQKLLSQYRNGFWDSDSAYYSQNLAWLGLTPPDRVSSLVRK
jgi:endoglucanase